jgi:cell division septal protein FtsQ
MYHNISEVQLRNGGDIVVYSTEGGVPIIFGRDDIPGQIVRLETFWNNVVHTRGTQLLQYIDLRYHDQIVARWNPEPSATKSL